MKTILIISLLVYMMYGVDWYNMTFMMKLPFVAYLLIAICGVIREAIE